MKIKLTSENLKVLQTMNLHRKYGNSVTKLADELDLTSSGTIHHIKRLKTAGKIKQDKKTKKWYVK